MCFEWTTGKNKAFAPLILIEPPSKLLNWHAEKHYFLSKYRFAIFTNKVICSTLTLYITNLGIDVRIIGMAQQRKPKFSLPCKILKELCNLPSKNIHFFQNADSQFLMNTVICSILTLFTSCKHRHRYYSVYRHHPNFRLVNFLIFSNHLWSWDAVPMKQSLELCRV